MTSKDFTITGTVNDKKIESISEITFDGQGFTLGENSAQILDALNKSKVVVELEKDPKGAVMVDTVGKKIIKLKQTVGGNYKKSRRNRNKRRKTNKRTP